MTTLTRPASKLADVVRSLDQYDRLAPGVRDSVRKLVPNDLAGLDEGVAVHAMNEVILVFIERGLSTILTAHGIPHPRYPVLRNGVTEVPSPQFWDTARSADPPGSWNVLGFDVGFPIGIPTCELTSTANWVEYYARQGFHVLTYRTVRSEERKSDVRDWAFLQGVDRPWDPGAIPDSVTSTDSTLPPDWRAISTATPFAAPSAAPKDWEPDIFDARGRLVEMGDRHLLIVSVTDSVDPAHKTTKAIAADFVEVAVRAERAGAQAIECYLARSTIKDPKTGELRSCELSPETSRAIVGEVRACLGSETKLVIKLSGDLPQEALESVVIPLAREGLIDGVSGISPVRVRVNRPDRSPMSQERLPGVAGFAIRSLGQAFVSRLARIRSENDLTFDIIGMGGATTPEDVATYRGLGAAAVQTASAARCDPGLASASAAWDGAASRSVRTTLETAEDWEGVVIDVADGTFVAHLTDINGEAPDEEAQFSIDEIQRGERAEVQLGAVFHWRTERVAEDGALVNRSWVRFRGLPPPSDEDIAAGERLAEESERAFGPKPKFPLD